MPFEVYPVRGVVHGFNDDNRTVSEVAQDIAAAYKKAASKGGAIIAGHTIDCEKAPKSVGRATDPLLHDRAYTGYSYLMLVAELPDLEKDGIAEPYDLDDSREQPAQ
jgi:hypothetical protein